MPHEDWNLWIFITAAAAFLLQFLTLVIGGTRKLSNVEISILAKIESVRRESEMSLEMTKKEFGETVHAIREKITQVELYTRDNFARRDTVYSRMDKLEAGINAIRDMLDARFVNIDLKLDRIRDSK